MSLLHVWDREDGLCENGSVRDHVQIPLTVKGFRVLEFIIKNACCRPISRDELLNKVWGCECHPCTRTVDNHNKARRVFYYWPISAATTSPNFFWISFWASGSKSVRSNIRRTSTISLSFPGMREAHSSASSRDFTWMIQ